MSFGDTSPIAQARRRSRLRGTLIRIAGTVGGGVVGALPALGTSLTALALGMLGVIAGTIAGFIYTGRRLGRPGVPQTTRGTVAVVLAIVVGAGMMFVSTPLSLFISIGLVVAAISQSRARRAALVSPPDQPGPQEPSGDR